MAISQRMSLEEFLKLPEEKPALELMNGVVTQKVSPKTRHSGLQGELIERLNGYARPRRLARAFPELRATFAGASTVPDVALFAWERIPRDAAGDLVDEVFEPPDLAVEIRSPGQSRRSQADRCLWYVANGVRIALLVDPLQRTVELFRLEARSGPLREADRIDLDDLLPGFELTVGELFAALRAV